MKNSSNVEINKELEDNEENTELNFNKSEDIVKVKDIELISSFNDSDFLLNEEDENKEDKKKKEENEIDVINAMNRIKENNVLKRENENLKNKLTKIATNSQKIIKKLKK